MRASVAAGCAALLAAGALAPAPPAAADETKQSAHYVMRVHGECPEAADLLRFAEAAYGKLAAYFGQAPSEKKLEIEYFAVLTDYNDKLRADGLPEEFYSPDGRYFPNSKRAYARRLEWDWDTRRALLVVLADQYMGLSVQGKRAGPPTWYRAGIFAHLGMHRWDGKTLTVGEDDDPGPWGRELAKVFDEARNGTLDATGAVPADAKLLMEAWPVVHYCLSSGDRAMYARFRGVERKMWEGLPVKESAEALLGADPKKLRETIRAWYAGKRQTFATVRDLWERTAEDGFLGTAKAGDEAILRATAEAPAAAFVEASFTPQGEAEGALLLNIDDAGGFLEARWRPGEKIVLERRIRPGQGEALATADGPAGPEARLRVEVAPGNVVRVLLAGKEACTWTAPSPEVLGKGSVGLLARNGRVRFTGFRHSVVPPPKK